MKHKLFYQRVNIFLLAVIEIGNSFVLLVADTKKIVRLDDRYRNRSLCAKYTFGESLYVLPLSVKTYSIVIYIIVKWNPERILVVAALVSFSSTAISTHSSEKHLSQPASYKMTNLRSTILRLKYYLNPSLDYIYEYRIFKGR